MNDIRYFKCENCNTLIRYPNWNKERERQINEMKCPQCFSNKLMTLKKRPYFRMKHKTFMTLWVTRDGIDVIISR